MSNQNDIMLPEAGDQELDGKYLTFFMQDQVLGISIRNVMQIVSLQPITPVPEFPSYCKGIINLRGSIIPLIDLHLRLGQPETEFTDRTCIIICSVHGSDIAFLVDAVDEVTDISDDMVSEPPHVQGSGESYLLGIARVERRGSEKIILLIESEKILSSNDLISLSYYG